jgi:hypothetical protein
MGFSSTPSSSNITIVRLIGFPTEDAWGKYIDEEHVNSLEDPIKFATDSVTEALGLDRVAT